MGAHDEPGYSYDWVGNMKAAASSNPWQYNAADQLTLWPGMHSYLYDDNGALTAVKTADGSATQQSFTYHPTGLMDAATFDGQTLTNLWDADEHRVQFSVGEDQYTAVFDVTAGIPAVIKETTPQGTIYYVREPGGELICRVIGESRWFYHFDELGSTRLITDDSGAVTDRYSYDAYGAVIAHDRNTGTIEQPYQYVGQLGYYTHYQAPEFGWLQLGVRFYDPETGRFERRDPVPAAPASVYEYAGGNPCSEADPHGLQASNPEREQRYRQCLSGALRRFTRCVAETYGTHDIAGLLVGCLAGCAAVSAWNGEFTWPVCAASCAVVGGCYGAYTLVRTYFRCVRPYRAQMRDCERIRGGG